MVVDVVKRKLDRIVGMGSERMVCKGRVFVSGFQSPKGSVKCGPCEGRGLLSVLLNV